MCWTWIGDGGGAAHLQVHREEESRGRDRGISMARGEKGVPETKVSQ